MEPRDPRFGVSWLAAATVTRAVEMKWKSVVSEET
jgi:hypothetical protein